MSVYLIVDAGGTKSDWVLISDCCSIVNLTSSGINPLQQSFAEITAIIGGIKEHLILYNIDKIFYFGTGCVGKVQKILIFNILKNFWPSADCEVESDIIGAAKALYGDDEGIVCILGTGSNTCHYANGKIKAQIPSLGFILGDEGSGSVMGKRLLNAVFKKQLPLNIINKFHSAYPLSIEEIVESTYKKPSPSAFLASFVPFLYENKAIKEIDSMIRAELDNFFIKNILPYQISENIKLGFVGSIALIFNDYLKDIARQHNLEISKIIKAPIKNLEEYYLYKQSENLKKNENK